MCFMWYCVYWLGNFRIKAKRNITVGLRTVWSMHNDDTWRKSNRFRVICIIVVGLLTIITSRYTSGRTGTIFMLILLLAMVVAVTYSEKCMIRKLINDF